MKTKYIFFGLILSICFSCSDVLDKKDLSAINDETVWNDKDYAKAYLDKLCRENLPEWATSGTARQGQSGDIPATPETPYTAGNSDEAGGGANVMYGELTTSSIDYWVYNQIRNINLLIQQIGSGTIDKETQDILKAQALVLRAWRYFQMVRLYGGVPIIMSPQALSDDLYVTRNKTSECVDMMVKDLDDAIAILPWTWTGNDAGRVTKAAAMAFKGRILLYHASPQFNPSRNTARWERAYAANKQAMDQLAENGYGLYESFEDIWFDEMNKGVVFVQRYQEPGTVHNWDAATRPLSEAQNQSGRNHPTLEMVESFPMITGVPITESDDYDPVYYWQNRDPRFKQTVAYNSCLWELSGKSGRRQWTYAGAELNYATESGFYCRKAVNLSYIPYYTERSSTDWIEIRYAEVMMNYAECAAELGRLDEAYAILKQIRKRAGIIPGSGEMYGLKQNMSYDDMMKAILFERKIEFAYEEKRYWDLRRRKLFESELNGTRRHGILPILNIPQAEFEAIQGTIDYEKEYHVYFRDSIVEVDKVFDINFRENYYFYAIPNKHLETNSKLEQTNGWPGGTFDPLD